MGLKERPLQTGIIYGPVNSRRLGRSLGINLLPTETKVCTFDCVYCQYGANLGLYDPATVGRLGLPTSEQVRVALEKTLAGLDALDVITLAGNGEPTLHPEFAGIARSAAELRDRFCSGAPICILSNGSTLDNESVRLALEKYVDRRIMKLDAGTRSAFQQVNRPAGGLQLDTLVEHLAALKDVEVQSLFFEGPHSNAGSGDIARWLDLLERIAPGSVQVYSLDRTPADKSLRPVSRERLEEIAGQVRQQLPRTGVQVF
ncbi:MAG: radical SAM protein [Gemmatimonadota bacterium]|nr:radical SAM protein [Gemmatimonadota bacterium]